jgi:hypothetical protein
LGVVRRGILAVLLLGMSAELLLRVHDKVAPTGARSRW